MGKRRQSNCNHIWKKVFPCLKDPWTLSRRYELREYYPDWHSIGAISLRLENLETLCWISIRKWEISSVSQGIRARWHMYRGRSAIIRKRLPCIVKRSPIGRRSATAARSHINWNVLRLLRKLRNRGNGQLNFWAQQ